MCCLVHCLLVFCLVVCLAAPDARVAAKAKTKAAILAVFCSVCVTASFSSFSHYPSLLPSEIYVACFHSESVKCALDLPDPPCFLCVWRNCKKLPRLQLATTRSAANCSSSFWAPVTRQHTASLSSKNYTLMHHLMHVQLATSASASPLKLSSQSSQVFET